MAKAWRGFVLAFGGLFLACAAPEKPKTVVATKAVEVTNPLSACRTTLFNRFARSVACPGARILFVSRRESPPELLKATQRNLRAYGYEAEDRVLFVDGRDHPAVGYFMGVFDKPVVSSLLLAFPAPNPEESIEAQCYAYGQRITPKVCSALLDAFVQQGLLRGEWPRVLSTSEPQESVVLDVLSREVRLPSSCSEIGPFDVRCKEGHVRMLVANEPAQLARMLEVDLKVNHDPSLLREWTTPCALEGVPTTCTVRRFRLPYSDELLNYTATAQVRGQSVLVSCEAQRSFAPTQPGAICSQFLHFEEGALVEPERSEDVGT